MEIVNDLERAQKVIKNKMWTLKKLSEETRIPYFTLRNYVKEPDKMETTAWRNVYKLAQVYDKIIQKDAKTVNDLEKAKMVIENKIWTLKKISEKTDIPYFTLRNYVKEPEKLETTAWKNVYKLAKIYDKIIK